MKTFIDLDKGIAYGSGKAWEFKLKSKSNTAKSRTTSLGFGTSFPSGVSQSSRQISSSNSEKQIDPSSAENYNPTTQQGHISKQRLGESEAANGQTTSWIKTDTDISSRSDDVSSVSLGGRRTLFPFSFFHIPYSIKERLRGWFF